MCCNAAVYFAGKPSITMIQLSSGASSLSVLDAGTATVTELNNLNISCTARGTPPPEVVWLKDGTLLQSQHGTRRWIQSTQMNQSGMATLYVSKLLLIDAGLYSCRVLDEGISLVQGETTWSFQLNVNGKCVSLNHAPLPGVPLIGCSMVLILCLSC